MSKLGVQEIELHQRNEDTEAQITKIGQQTEKLSQEQATVDDEEQKVYTYLVIAHKNSRKNTFVNTCTCAELDSPPGKTQAVGPKKGKSTV